MHLFLGLDSYYRYPKKTLMRVCVKMPMHENYIDGTFCLLEHIFEVTEPLRNTLVGTDLNLYVCMFGVDVCW